MDALNINSVTYPLSKRDFKYHKALGISIQGQSANVFFAEAKRLASVYSLPVKLVIRDRHNNLETVEF